MKTIKEFYCETYPSDELGAEINPKAVWADLVTIVKSGWLYEYLGVSDSIVRERVFEKFSEIYGRDYKFIYELWLKS